MRLFRNKNKNFKKVKISVTHKESKKERTLKAQYL